MWTFTTNKPVPRSRRLPSHRMQRPPVVLYSHSGARKGDADDAVDVQESNYLDVVFFITDCTCSN